MLANYLIHLRTSRGIPRSKWARNSGISYPTLWRWETGQTLPRDQEILLALKALSVTAGERQKALHLLAAARNGHGVQQLAALASMPFTQPELLKALRVRQGSTQQEVAARLQIPRATLTHWECGDRWPAIDRLHTLLQLYGALPEEIALLTLTPHEPMDTQHTGVQERIDIETYTGDFRLLDLHYLVRLGHLTESANTRAREQEIETRLDYAHFLLSEGRRSEMVKQIGRITDRETLSQNPALYSRYRILTIDSRWTAQKRSLWNGLLRQLQAITALGSALPRPELNWARFEVMYSLHQMGDEEAAIASGKQAVTEVERYSTDQGEREKAYRALANVYLWQNRWEDAQDALAQISDRSPLLHMHRELTAAWIAESQSDRRLLREAYTKASQTASQYGMLHQKQSLERKLSALA